MTMKSTFVAAALALSLPALAATAGTASAGDGINTRIHIGITTPGLHIGGPVYAHGPRYRYRHWHRYRRCRPTFAKRRVWLPGRGWVRARVKVGRTCRMVWR